MQHGAGLNEIALAFVNTTSRSYFGKMNLTLGSVVPLAMFFSMHLFLNIKISFQARAGGCFQKPGILFSLQDLCFASDGSPAQS